MVICNGVPKAGTNILMKLCALLGLKNINLNLVAFHPYTMVRAKVPFGHIGYKNAWASAMNVWHYPDSFFCHAHIAHNCEPNLYCEPNLIIFRDPRNAAVSHVRWTTTRDAGIHKRGHTPDSRQELLRLIREGWEGHDNYVELWFAFTGWMHTEQSNMCVLFFEDIFEPWAIKKVARYLGHPYDTEWITQNLWGGKELPSGEDAYFTGSSFSGQHSNWEDWWTDEIDKVWVDCGGKELVEMVDKCRTFFRMQDNARFEVAPCPTRPSPVYTLFGIPPNREGAGGTGAFGMAGHIGRVQPINFAGED